MNSGKRHWTNSWCASFQIVNITLSYYTIVVLSWLALDIDKTFPKLLRGPVFFSTKNHAIDGLTGQKSQVLSFHLVITQQSHQNWDPLTLNNQFDFLHHGKLRNKLAHISTDKSDLKQKCTKILDTIFHHTFRPSVWSIFSRQTCCVWD